RLQQMVGRELLVAFTQRDGLRRLNEAASPVRVDLKIHASLLRARVLRPCGTDQRLSLQERVRRPRGGLKIAVEHRAETFPTGDIVCSTPGKRGALRPSFRPQQVASAMSVYGANPDGAAPRALPLPGQRLVGRATGADHP